MHIGGIVPNTQINLQIQISQILIKGSIYSLSEVLNLITRSTHCLILTVFHMATWEECCQGGAELVQHRHGYRDQQPVRSTCYGMLTKIKKPGSEKIALSEKVVHLYKYFDT